MFVAQTLTGPLSHRELAVDELRRRIQMGTGRAGSVARRTSVAGRLRRRVTAGLMGPVLAAGSSVVVLLQNGETTAPETTALEAAGDSVTQQTPAEWAADSTAYFTGFAA